MRMNPSVIPYACPHLTAEDKAAVLSVLESDYLTQGPITERFEAAIADYCDIPHAVALSNATAALHVACLALGIEKGDKVWTSPNSFVASANCALYCGATIDFVDIDHRTGNMCVQALAQKLADTQQAGHALPKLLIPVHFAGQPCDMQEIAALAERYGFLILEDAAHALGASYQAEKIGHCQYSIMTVFSLHAIKNITSGEGGVLTTADPVLAEKCRLLRSHGIVREPKEEEYWEGAWCYQQQILGFNYRMTELQAALGLSQCTRIDSITAERREKAAYYRAQGIPSLIQKDDRCSAWHLYVSMVAPESRKTIFQGLRAEHIMAHVHYMPIYQQPYYQQLGFSMRYCPGMELYYASCLTLPLHNRLSLADQNRVIQAWQRLKAQEKRTMLEEGF